MLQINVNEKFQFQLDQAELDWDIVPIGNNLFHIIKDHQSFTAEVVSYERKNKTLQLKLEGQVYDIQIKDKMDLLLEKMGISNANANKISNIKAPMPGLVLSIEAKVGDELQKGDQVLILEAMKMENVLKSPGEGVIKSIAVKPGDAVEKGQVLINLE